MVHLVVHCGYFHITLNVIYRLVIFRTFTLVNGHLSALLSFQNFL
jgi:hypothetical protein